MRSGIDAGWKSLTCIVREGDAAVGRDHNVLSIAGGCHFELALSILDVAVPLPSHRHNLTRKRCSTFWSGCSVPG